MLCGSHIKIWNLGNHMKNIKNWKLRVWCSLFHFFHVICKISNFNIWTAKHLAQASCTELTLSLRSWNFSVLVHNLSIKKRNFFLYMIQPNLTRRNVDFWTSLVNVYNLVAISKSCIQREEDGETRCHHCIMPNSNSWLHA